jgi:hypothetical protein
MSSDPPRRLPDRSMLGLSRGRARGREHPPVSVRAAGNPKKESGSRPCQPGKGGQPDTQAMGSLGQGLSRGPNLRCGNSRSRRRAPLRGRGPCPARQVARHRAARLVKNDLDGQGRGGRRLQRSGFRPRRGGMTQQHLFGHVLLESVSTALNRATGFSVAEVQPGVAPVPLRHKSQCGRRRPALGTTLIID